MANSRWLEQYAGIYAGDHWKMSVHFIPERAPSTVGATDGYCGISWPTKVRKFIGNFCDMVDLGDMSLSPVSDVTSMGGGKTPVKRTFGLKLDPFTVNFNGNSLGSFRALIGQTQSAATNNATLVTAPTYATGGHLLLKAYNPSTGACATEVLIMNVQATLKTLTGNTKESGERYFPVELSSESTEIYIVDQANNGQSIFVEGWYDNAGTDINTNWDGNETTVVLGTGNASYLSATTPVALPIGTSYTQLTDYHTHLIRASIDGVQVSDAELAFATSTLTFSTATARSNTALLVIYIANSTTYTNPNYSGAAQPTEIRDMWYGWPAYMRA